jgi:hypothetical protein
MKKMAWTLMAVVGLAGMASADSGWGVYGSYWAPDSFEAVGGVGGKLSIELAPHASLEFAGTWFQSLEDQAGDSTTTLDMIPLDIGLSFMSGMKPVDVYMRAGYTYYSVDGAIYTDGRKQDVDFGDASGFYAGLGIEVPLSEHPEITGATRTTFMVEALYRYTSLDELSSRDERYVGGDIDGLCINAGFMLRW